MTTNHGVHYLDVQDADAIFLYYENGNKSYVILIDAGNIGDSDKIKQHLLDNFGTTTIDLAVCTHPDADHMGGFFGLLKDRALSIKEFWLLSPKDAKASLYTYSDYLSDPTPAANFDHPTDPNSKNLISLAKEKCWYVYNVFQGHCHPEIPLRVLGPTKEFYYPLSKEILEKNSVPEEEETSKYEDTGDWRMEQAKSSIDNEPDDDSPTNAGSIILLFEPGSGQKFLLLGDANRAAICDVLSNYSNLAGCIVKVPHHGSKHNLNSTIIDKLAPTCAIISAKGTKKHPSRGVVHCLSKHCDVFSTHVSGNLVHHKSFKGKPAEPLKRKQN